MAFLLSAGSAIISTMVSILLFIPMLILKTFRKEKPINGGWSNWEASNECSSDNSDSVELTRRCDNPAPAFGGKYCTPDEELLRLTKIQSCPQCNIDHEDWVISEPCKFDPVTKTYRHWMVRGNSDDLTSCKVQGKWNDNICPAVYGNLSDWSGMMSQTILTGGIAVSAVKFLGTWGELQNPTYGRVTTSTLMVTKLKIYDSDDNMVYDLPAMIIDGSQAAEPVADVDQLSKTVQVGPFPMVSRIEFDIFVSASQRPQPVTIINGEDIVSEVTPEPYGLTTHSYPISQKVIDVSITKCDSTQSGTVNWSRTCSNPQYILGTNYTDEDEDNGLGIAGQPREPSTYCDQSDGYSLTKTTECP